MMKFGFIRAALFAAMLAVGFAPTVALADQPAQASTIDTSGLPADKLKQIQDIVASGQSVTQTALQAVSPEAISSYAEFGKAVGESVAEAAKAIGVAAKDFSETWVGKVAIFMIVWKLMLADIMVGLSDVVIGAAWIITAVAIWTRYFKRICLIDSTTTETYERKVKDANGNYVKNEAGEYETEKVTAVIVKGQDIQDGAVAVYRIFMFVALAIMVTPGIVFLA